MLIGTASSTSTAACKQHKRDQVATAFRIEVAETRAAEERGLIGYAVSAAAHHLRQPFMKTNSNPTHCPAT